MRRSIFSSTILVLFFAGQVYSEGGEEVKAIEARVAQIDSVRYVLNQNFLIFLKMVNDSVLIPVTDTTNWPESDSVASTYNVMTDSTGKLVLFYEMPFSESGDWFIYCEYHFAPNGRLLKYERYVSTFNSECTGVLRDRHEWYYAEDGAILSESRAFTDGNNQPVDTVGCYLRDDLQCEVLMRAEEVRQKLKL